jgi:hypothetical protein
VQGNASLKSTGPDDATLSVHLSTHTCNIPSCIPSDLEFPLAGPSTSQP